jgi:RNA-directed DNA polymerase
MLRIIKNRVAIMTFSFKKHLPKQEEIIHSQDFFDDLKNYQKNLEKNDLPVIYSLPHLCLLAGVNIKNVVEIANTDRLNFYKRFKLKKKRGGYRVIHIPNDELKYLQRWILANILEKRQSHYSCKGFDKLSSTKQNAEIHLKSDAILKLDLLRFYDSINEKRIYGIFRSFGYQKNLAISFAKLCTTEPDKLFLDSFKQKEQNLKNNILLRIDEGFLPQGSPTSPKLSNLIANNLDNRLSKLADKNDLKYSRYADDLTFSGNIETLKRIKKVIYKIIIDENFFVNYSKTKFLIRGNPFFITGLSVNNDKVTIPKKRKKEIEHHLFHCKKNGVENHLKISNIKNRNFKDWLLGNIAYVYSVEKEIGKIYFEDFNKIQWPI